MLKGEQTELKKKIALALADLLLVISAFFAPATTATWHGPVTGSTYVVTGGKMWAKVQLHLGPVPLPPLSLPFVSRPPYITPGTMWQDINFSVPIDPGLLGLPPLGVPGVVFLTIPWQSIQSLEHVFFSDTLGYTRIKLLPVPESDGMGWLYLLPGIADVDIHVNNTYMMNAAPPPYNVSNPDTIPIAIWTSPSPTPGAFAAVPIQQFYPFPDPGPDTLPGYFQAPFVPGTQDDGFGDGIPDPAGSSVLFIPMQLSIEAWNGTAWIFQFGGPFIMPMTTGTASDTVWPPTGSGVDGENITCTGAPWENIASTGMWGASKNKRFVTYVCAWSFIQYYLSDGPPVVKLDFIYGMEEKKVIDVWSGAAASDCNGDNQVDIIDIVITAIAFGTYDEGAVFWGEYDPIAFGHSPPWPGPYPLDMPAPWLVCSTFHRLWEPPIEPPPPWPWGDWPLGYFDARADVWSDGLIDIMDLVYIAVVGWGREIFES